MYILLPYYRRGNLQDAINANLVNHAKFPERRLMVLFLGVAQALKGMHQYRMKGAPGGARSQKQARRVREEGEREDKDAARQAKRGGTRIDVEEDVEQQEPLMNGEVTRSQEGVEEGELRAYAHMDVKPGMYDHSFLPLLSRKSHIPSFPSPLPMTLNRNPMRKKKTGNIMISDSGTSPILMDLGSLAPIPVHITSRALALQTQDLAAEHSTLPYRAPELFDCPVGGTVDGKADIWSLGCTLFACLVGKSPFEMRSEETGGSLSMCVCSGDWRFPDEESGGGRRKKKKKGKGKGEETGEEEEDGAISERVREVVRACLRVEASERPDVDEVIGMIEKVVEELPPDDEGDEGGEEG